MPAEIVSYVELEDVFPGRECSIAYLSECLSALPLDLVLEMCARANQITSGSSNLSLIERQRKLAGGILSPEALENLKNATRRSNAGDPHKVALFSRAQLIELTRWALLLSNADAPPLGRPWNQEEKDMFVQAALICSWLSGARVRAMLEKNKEIDANVAPNYNPVYKWKFGWEYSLDPMSYRNLKSFMKARIAKIKKLRGTVLEKKITQMKLQKVKKEFEEEQKIKTEKFEKQEKIKKMQAQRYQTLDTVVRDPGVYIICEEKKSLTKVKNKINCLYIGESQVLAKRLSSYSNINKKNHELVDKISRKLKKPREEILEKLKDNIKVRTLRFKRMENSDERRKIEGYLINRLKPLANTSKNN